MFDQFTVSPTDYDPFDGPEAKAALDYAKSLEGAPSAEAKPEGGTSIAWNTAGKPIAPPEAQRGPKPGTQQPQSVEQFFGGSAPDWQKWASVPSELAFRVGGGAVESAVEAARSLKPLMDKAKGTELLTKEGVEQSMPDVFNLTQFAMGGGSGGGAKALTSGWGGAAEEFLKGFAKETAPQFPATAKIISKMADYGPEEAAKLATSKPGPIGANPVQTDALLHAKALEAAEKAGVDATVDLLNKHWEDKNWKAYNDVFQAIFPPGNSNPFNFGPQKAQAAALPPTGSSPYYVHPQDFHPDWDPGAAKFLNQYAQDPWMQKKAGASGAPIAQDAMDMLVLGPEHAQQLMPNKLASNVLAVQKTQEASKAAVAAKVAAKVAAVQPKPVPNADGSLAEWWVDHEKAAQNSPVPVQTTKWGKQVHTQTKEDGTQVVIQNPHIAINNWSDPNKLSTVTPNGGADKAKDFGEFDPPTDPKGWEWEAEEVKEKEPFVPVAGKKSAAGVVIKDPDGSYYIVSPTNKFGGSGYIFPKGGQDAGLSLGATAVKEAYEETGMKVKLLQHIGDYEKSTSKVRYYLAEPEAGSPANMGWETQAVHKVPASSVLDILDNPVDKKIFADAQKLKVPAKPEPAPFPLQKISSTALTKVGPQMGSNPGGVYENKIGGQYYVKFPKSEDHARNEALANRLYGDLGVPVPPVSAAAIGGKPAVMSAMQHDVKPFDPKDPQQVADVQKHFAAHAWLANWDAIGLSMDNQVKHPMQGMMTIDAGGALKYRAQGDPKPNFGPTVDEWDSMRQKGTAGKIFGGMTDKQLAESALPVLKLKEDDIRAAVKNTGMPSSMADTLLARQKDLANRVSVLPIAIQAPTPELIDALRAVLAPKNSPSVASPIALAKGKASGQSSPLTAQQILSGQVPKAKPSVGKTPGYFSPKATMKQPNTPGDMSWLLKDPDPAIKRMYKESKAAFVNEPVPQHAQMPFNPNKLSMKPADVAQRAKAEGWWWDQPVYRGMKPIGSTKSLKPNYEQFNDPASSHGGEPGIFLLPEFSVSGDSGKSTSQAYGTPTKLIMRSDNPLFVDWKDVTGQNGYNHEKMKRVILNAWSKGYDSLHMRNIKDIGTSNYHDQIVVRYPQQLRWGEPGKAAFDPKLTGNSELFASRSPLGGALALPQGQQDEEQQK